MQYGRDLDVRIRDSLKGNFFGIFWGFLPRIIQSMNDMKG